MQEHDPKLDLVLERVVDVPVELVWMAWTTPEHLKQWFTPRPWATTECEIDLRPGGLFRTVMRGPEGQEFANVGCYLEAVENERLVWTNVLLPGFRPAGPAIVGMEQDLRFTAAILLERQGSGTKYTAVVKHGKESDRKRHEEMCFRDGWGTALDQLVASVKGVQRTP